MSVRTGLSASFPQGRLGRRRTSGRRETEKREGDWKTQRCGMSKRSRKEVGNCNKDEWSKSEKGWVNGKEERGDCIWDNYFKEKKKSKELALMEETRSKKMAATSWSERVRFNEWVKKKSRKRRWWEVIKRMNGDLEEGAGEHDFAMAERKRKEKKNTGSERGFTDSEAHWHLCLCPHLCLIKHHPAAINPHLHAQTQCTHMHGHSHTHTALHSEPSPEWKPEEKCVAEKKKKHHPSMHSSTPSLSPSSLPAFLSLIMKNQSRNWSSHALQTSLTHYTTLRYTHTQSEMILTEMFDAPGILKRFMDQFASWSLSCSMYAYTSPPTCGGQIASRLGF